MQNYPARQSTAGLLALLLATTAPVFAQTAATPTTPATPAVAAAATEEAIKLDQYVVTGNRASVISALETKRDKLEIVDSIVASDINKLPDYNVTDALQRITGVQILRDRGEGAGIAIRGLTQMETTMNGREVFTAGLGSTGGPSRIVDFADIPSELVASINVYKTGAANHIEGGIGGLVDLVTRRPLDFKGLTAAATIRLINGDLAEKTKPQYSLLVSERVKLKDGGEIGALVNATYQERAWREDQKGTGAPAARTNIVAGQTIIAQPSTSENTVYGTRKRTGISGVVQWRPNTRLEFYGEANYTKFNTLQDTQQINASGTTIDPTSIVLVDGPTPGAKDLQKASWLNPSITVLSFARDTHDWTKQFAGGAIWRGQDLTLKFDASYTKSYNDLYFSGPFFATTAAKFTQDLSSLKPATYVTGTNLTDPSIYQYTGIAYRYRPYHGDLTSMTADATYKLDNAFIPQIDAGVRAGAHKANNKPGLIFADYSFPAASRPAATLYPGLIGTNTRGFFPNDSDMPSIRNFMTGVLSGARDAVPYRAQFGITTPLPSAASALTLWSIKEETKAAYLMGRIKAASLPIDGNVGVRFVRTTEKVSGHQGTSAANAVPININSSYNRYLPSLNLRYELQESLYLRFSASKSLTRPDFNQLSPSLTLVPNPVDPSLNQGSAGNPALKPIESDNYDLALEKYFNKSSSVYVTWFHKKVDGFIVSSRLTEHWDGQDYMISRPRNSDPAKIKGFEVGFTQFMDFLPGQLRNLGLQANYTYIDSNARNRTLETAGTPVYTPLQNLSRNSYNLIGMFENKKVSARLAYNWRSKFLSGQTNIANVGAFPFYTKAYGWLDASIGYRFNDRVSVNLEGTNLLRTKRLSYYGVKSRPQNVYVNDRQISTSVTVRY